MKEHERSRVNGDDKLWFGKHSNEELHASVTTEQNFELIRVENNVGKRRLQEQVEILKVKKEKKLNLLNNLTYFESGKLFGPVVGGRLQRE
jgi:hypothetical protein